MRHVDATMQPAQPGFKISISAPRRGLGRKGGDVQVEVPPSWVRGTSRSPLPYYLADSLYEHLHMFD